MAGTHQNQRQVVSFFTNGKRANDRYGLADEVGRIVKRADQAKVRAVASTARKVSPLAKALLTSRYSVPPSQLTNRVRVRIDPDTFRVDASQLRLPLVLFGGHWAGRQSPGATASIVLGQTRTYAGAFIAPGRFRGQAMPLIYTRRRGKKVLMKSGRYRGKMREAIVANRGPSVYDMLLGYLGTDARSGSKLRIPDLDASDTLQAQLISFYISELKRLYAVEASSG